MKHVILLISIILLSSCCGTKKVVQNQSNIKTKDIAQVVVEKPPHETEVDVDVDVDVNVETKETIEVEVETPTDIVEKIDHETIIANPEAFDHMSWNDLLQQYVSKKGNVNYKGFKTNRKALTNYIASLGNNMPNETWNTQDRLAYWINAYNAMTIDLILRNYPTKSIKDIDKPWEQRLWKLKNKWYNLDEIEHQILRKMDEPRIHFGIVCASFSCPKLQNEAFTASNLETQLTNATKEFLSDSARNNITEDSVKLSKIFKWFKKDFETDGSLIDFINKYSDISVSTKAKKSFKDYNWDLNE